MFIWKTKSGKENGRKIKLAMIKSMSLLIACAESLLCTKDTREGFRLCIES